MGIDTRHWGPSGWQLLHLIAFKATNPEKFLSNIGNSLPCKFCRHSTKQYIREFPLKGDPGEWLYEIHNKVNHKLRTQCKGDPKVIDPGENPSFEDVRKMYAHQTLNGIHGREFLLSIAVNYKQTPVRTRIQRTFLKQLADVYPEFKKYYDNNPPNFKSYPEWMVKFTGGSIAETLKFKSKCKKGKTCRKKYGGGRRLTLRV